MCDNQNYIFNRGKLAKDRFAFLPLGSVKVNGWLNNQLLTLSDGLTGEMEKYPDYSASSAWLGGNGEDWERGPYYMRGLVAQAYQLKDEKLIKKALKWINAVIESQKDNGFFGPITNTDWWPRMPVLMALRDYFEATEALGETDERVLPFMEKYFRYQLKTMPENPLCSWARARGGDNMDSVYWLYNRLFDENAPDKTDWLLELARIIRSQTQDWTDIFTNTTAREHVVNTSQAMKMPIVAYQGSHDKADWNALKKGLENIKIDHGRIDELPNSDEAARDNKPTRGTELCGIAEGMLSSEIAMRITGEGWLGDHLETLAFNALPAAYSPDYLAHVYFITQNQVLAARGKRGFDCDHGDSAAFGAPGGFDCCFANNHMAWPKFFQSMWMATREGGLAVIAYGSNEVAAKVADGKNAAFLQTTDYPFDDKIKLDYSGDTAVFPLMLRIPNWCGDPGITLNGEKVNLKAEKLKNGFLTLDREWTAGDVVEIEFPADIDISSWYNDAAAVKRGALIFALKVKEKWVESSADNSVRELKVSLNGKLKCYEVYPESRWNYGLVTDGEFVIKRNEIQAQPFKFDSAPVEITCTGQVIPEWKLDGNIAGELPFGAVERDESLCENITLIPYGCGRLKITQFPRVLNKIDGAAARKNAKTVNGGYLFENVVVPPAKEYSAVIKTDRDGELSVTVNGKSTVSVKTSDKTAVLSGLKSLIPDTATQFNCAHLNSVYIKGENIEVEEICVALEDYDFHITAATCFEAAEIEYNILPDATHYVLNCRKNGENVISERVYSNRYKGGAPFEADRHSVTLSGGEYEISMTAYRDKTKICESNTVKVNV